MGICTMTEVVFRAQYPDGEKARRDIELVQWPNRPFCPRCGSTTRIGFQKRKTVSGY